MRFSRLKIAVAVAIVALACSSASFADTVTLDNPDQTGFTGSTFHFFGTFTGNNVQGDNFVWTSASPCLGLDPNGCIDDTGFIFANSGEFSSFFDVFVDLSIVPGVYTGRFTITDGDGNSLDAQDFSITVSSPGNDTPEPASLVLLGSGFLGAATTLRRRFKA